MLDISLDAATCLKMLNRLIGTEMRFVYLNHKGELEVRHVVVERVFFGTKLPYHQEHQWLFEALDLERQATRTFAFEHICPEGAEAFSIKEKL
ncbi:hypothetical protein EHF33_20450 (plasmid) [Deinococcus psychrotolerans]|uniref:WYL domain-containing protein n=1 Tax=Deinococcus psychrotolerans TaxID=2489213 RepID=A0A3G8YK09_9DEIO|nr:hypothetical protein [Deinococcus psychrotolerans]AZI45283.1 hypothetical protein EHF33_20450 [Deinococcus psychrotolerans]